MMQFRLVLAVLLTGLVLSPACAQPCQQPTPVSLFGWKEHQQIMLLQRQLADANAAHIASLQLQINQLQLMILQQQQQQRGPNQPQPPINIYLPGPGPHLDPSPGIPRLDPNPGVPKLDPNPGVPKLDPNPGVPRLDLKPGPAPKLDPKPGVPMGPPVGYQTYTDRTAPPKITLPRPDSRPPIISATITDRNGVVRPVEPAVWVPVPQK